MVISSLSLPALSMSAFVIAGDVSRATAAASNEIYLDGSGGNYSLTRNRTSLLDSRFRSIVRQHYDFSCGSAAVATLLTYHYGHPIEESTVLNAMYIKGDQEKIHKEGFSLLDMKNFIESIGYRAEGYRESLDKLRKVDIPAIVLINRRGYMHFVVVKGVTDEKVSVGDPTLGLRIYDRKDFEKMWNGILFVILNDKNIANASFNSDSNWTTNGHPYFQQMLDREALGSLTVDISFTPNYY